MTDTTQDNHRAEQESLFRAASRLDEALAISSTSPEWPSVTRSAVRACTLAVEQALDNLSGSNGLGEAVIEREPRLIPALEKLEAGMAGLLVEFWEAKGHAPTPDFVIRLRDLLVELREVAGEAFALTYESLTSPGGQD